MIKGPQIRRLAAGFHYITAITKPQIESLLRQGVIQMELFDEELAEVRPHDGRNGGNADRAVGRRYILRRNPQRTLEMAYSRNDKRASIASKSHKETHIWPASASKRGNGPS